MTPTTFIIGLAIVFVILFIFNNLKMTSGEYLVFAVAFFLLSAFQFGYNVSKSENFTTAPLRTAPQTRPTAALRPQDQQNMAKHVASSAGYYQGAIDYDAEGESAPPERSGKSAAPSAVGESAAPRPQADTDDMINFNTISRNRNDRATAGVTKRGKLIEHYVKDELEEQEHRDWYSEHEF